MTEQELIEYILDTDDRLTKIVENSREAERGINWERS